MSVAQKLILIIILSFLSPKNAQAEEQSCEESLQTTADTSVNLEEQNFIKQKARELFINLTVRHGELISEDDPNAYVERIYQSFDNIKNLTANPDAEVKGYNTRLELKIQQTSVINENSRVTTYFRNFENKDKETYKVASTLWSRKAQESPNEDWHKAIEKSFEYVNFYKNLKVDVYKITAKGFEALELANILRRLIRAYGAKYFLSTTARYQGLDFERPIYFYSSNSEKIEKTYTHSKIFRFDTLVADYKSALKTYEEVFGIRSNPYTLIRNKLESRTPYDWSQLKKPSYIILSPFYLIISTLKLAKTVINTGAQSLQWISSTIFHPKGAFHVRMIQQAFELRRLEIIRNVIVGRADNLNVELNEQEKRLVDSINQALLDIQLVPNSSAISFIQKEEYEAEKSILFGNEIETPGSDPQRHLTIYSGFDREPKMRTIQAYYYDKFKQKVKKWAPPIIATGLIIGTVSTQYESTKKRLLDKPEIAIELTKFGNIFYDLKKEWFGLDYLVYDQVVESNRTWALENLNMSAATMDGTQIFQDTYRIDSTQDFISNPEYQSQVREIIKVTLQEREARGGALAYQYAVNQTVEWGYPSRTVEILFAELLNVYLEEEAYLKTLQSMVLTDIDQYTQPTTQISKYTDYLLETSEQISKELFNDLYYLFNFKLTEAIEHYAFYGSLLNPYGTVFDYFINSPYKIHFLKEGWFLRFSPHKTHDSVVYESSYIQAVYLLSEPNEDNYIEVHLLGGPESESPSGKFFVHSDAIISD